MTEYDISIILPGIRNEKWVGLFNSLEKSTTKKFELVAVGPYEPPEELKSKPNFKFIQDWGNPVRAQQIAAEHSTGKFITWAADDGLFVEGALDEALDYLEAKDKNEVVVFNYTENEALVPTHVLRLNVAYPKTPYIPDDWFIFNVAIMNTEYFRELGGYDCEFEGTAVSHADLAARAQRYGAKVHLVNKPMLRCSWIPGREGDHFAIHDAQIYHDQPLYVKIYSTPDCEDRECIDFNNWKNVPAKWERRFGK